MNANGFFLQYDFSSWNKNKGKTLNYIHTNVITIYNHSNGHGFTILRTLCLMSFLCRIRPVLLSSWFPHGSLASSAVADQLLILFPTGWARPPFRPPPHGDPISLRVHTLTHPSVCYRNTLSITMASACTELGTVKDNVFSGTVLAFSIIPWIIVGIFLLFRIFT